MSNPCKTCGATPTLMISGLSYHQEWCFRQRETDKKFVTIMKVIDQQTDLIEALTKAVKAMARKMEDM